MLHSFQKAMVAALKQKRGDSVCRADLLLPEHDA